MAKPGRLGDAKLPSHADRGAAEVTDQYYIERLLFVVI